MIKKEDIQKLAELSRIEVAPDELAKLSSDIESILEYVGEIQEVTTEEPVSEAGVLRNVLREDEHPHKSQEFTEDLLSASPNREGEYVSVKKILE